MLYLSGWSHGSADPAKKFARFFILRKDSVRTPDSRLFDVRSMHLGSSCTRPTRGPVCASKGQRSSLGGLTLRRAFVAGVALLAGGLAFSGASATAQGTPGPITPKPGETVHKAAPNTTPVKVLQV